MKLWANSVLGSCAWRKLYCIRVTETWRTFDVVLTIPDRDLGMIARAARKTLRGLSARNRSHINGQLPLGFIWSALSRSIRRLAGFLMCALLTPIVKNFYKSSIALAFESEKSPHNL